MSLGAAMVETSCTIRGRIVRDFMANSYWLERMVQVGIIWKNSAWVARIESSSSRFEEGLKSLSNIPCAYKSQFDSKHACQLHMKV